MTEKAKILVIDDAPEMCRFYHLVLTKAGFDVLTAENGKKGLALADTENPNLILLDLRLPDMDGTDILKIFRSSGKTEKTPILVFSGSASKAKVDEIISLGANAVVFKGMIPIKQMVDKIKSLLDVPPAPQQL